MKQAGASALNKIRRRLTITGASDTIDGVSKLSVSESNNGPSLHSTTTRCAVKEYAGTSKKGHAPYNPRKENQDALVMCDDPATNTLILCALDGHGEHGDAVAGAFRDQLAQQMIAHPKWTVDVKTAAANVIANIEQSVIRNFRIDTEFSGTTLSMAIIRGNTITGINIGDSRVIIGKIAPNNVNADESGLNCTGGVGATVEHKILAEEFTHDHKPDLPLEKKRILDAGGRVFAVEYDDGIDGPPRVWLGHMDVPGLAMSRCVCVFVFMCVYEHCLQLLYLVTFDDSLVIHSERMLNELVHVSFSNVCGTINNGYKKVLSVNILASVYF